MQKKKKSLLDFSSYYKNKQTKMNTENLFFLTTADTALNVFSINYEKMKPVPLCENLA